VTLSYRGKNEEAIRYLEESLALAQQANFQVSTSWIISALGFAALGGGNHARAEELFRESLRLAKSTVRHRVPDSLEGLAELELARARQETTQAHAHRAATLVGAAESVRHILSMKIIPARASARDRLIADARSRLGEAEYEQSFSVGRMMSLEEAISYALSR
jgi:tetratricopeptide (TPR) repeat protein